MTERDRNKIKRALELAAFSATAVDTDSSSRFFRIEAFLDAARTKPACAQVRRSAIAGMDDAMDQAARELGAA